MENTFIEYPKCTTCQKAKKWLRENNIQFEERHIVEETPTAKEIKQWIEMSGKDIKKFFNTSGLKYKEMQLKDRLEDMNMDEKLKLLESNGMLIKRPILVSKEGILIGFKEQEWKEFFHQK